MLVDVRYANPAPCGPVAPVAPAPLTKGAPLSVIVPVFDSANVYVPATNVDESLTKGSPFNVTLPVVDNENVYVPAIRDEPDSSVDNILSISPKLELILVKASRSVSPLPAFAPEPVLI